MQKSAFLGRKPGILQWIVGLQLVMVRTPVFSGV